MAILCTDIEQLFQMFLSVLKLLSLIICTYLVEKRARKIGKNLIKKNPQVAAAKKLYIIKGPSNNNTEQKIKETQPCCSRLSE